MVDAVDTVTLYHSAFPGKGIAWANNQLVVVPPGWNLGKNGASKLTTLWVLFWYSDDTVKDPPLEIIEFLKVRDLFDFVYLSYEVMVNLEHSPDVPKRPDDPTSLPGWIEYDDEWIDDAFTKAQETDPENPYLLEFLNFKKKNTSAAKYGRSEKGKLAQKKWRQSDSAREQAKVRADEKKEERAEFRIIRDWLEANPGKGTKDFPAELLD